MAKRTTTTSHSSVDQSAALPTMMDHIRELQGRLFSTVVAFILITGAAYPFFDKIATILMAPLKNGQELVYLTPGGAFSFIIKVCVYIGIIGTLPIIIFHLYRFLMPAVRHVHLRTVLKYTLASILLALCGIVFAYYVSLPASLYFLTSFDLNHINPMLTIDAYFSFVMTYILAGALLFQLPIVMLIINTASPLTPSKLMSRQRHIIVGSFIVAAVISPTPDALNQALLASPMVVMYQLGIIIIWLTNRKRAKTTRAAQKAVITSPSKFSGKLSHALPTITKDIRSNDKNNSLTRAGLIDLTRDSTNYQHSLLPQERLTHTQQLRPLKLKKNIDGFRNDSSLSVAIRTDIKMRIPSKSNRFNSRNIERKAAGISRVSDRPMRTIDGIIVPKRLRA